MNCHLMRGLLALYPRAFRDRYGTELGSLTDELIGAGEITRLRAALNLVWGAVLEWARVLFYSRRTVQAMAAAAIVAVAGTLYVTSQARPQSTPASARGDSVPAAFSFGVGSCSLRDQQLWIVAGKVTAKPGQVFRVQVPQAGLVPGGFSVQGRPWPAGARPDAPRPIPAGQCVITLIPPSGGG